MIYLYLRIDISIIYIRRSGGAKAPPSLETIEAIETIAIIATIETIEAIDQRLWNDD